MNIPQSIIGLLSELISENETHASLDSLFMYADAPGDPPDGSKPVKVMEWLRRCNKDNDTDAIAVLRVIVERYLQEEVDESSPRFDWVQERNKKLTIALHNTALGNLVGEEMSPQSKTLEEVIAELDSDSLNYEFERALSSADDDPFEAVSASANILEATMRVLFEDSGVELPKKKDLSNLWGLMRSELGIDQKRIEDHDIQKIISGLNSIITGIAALRTHTSSAHGRGRFRYSLQKRHVNLSIHSAHSLCLFIIESWKERNG